MPASSEAGPVDSQDRPEQTCRATVPSMTVVTSAPVTATSSSVTATSGSETATTSTSMTSTSSAASADSSQTCFTAEQCCELSKQLFSDNDTDTVGVHNRYLCQQSFCNDLSEGEKKRLLPKKFQHDKLKDYWWLCFVEGQGMFCLLCKKHNMKHTLNKRDNLCTISV